MTRNEEEMKVDLYNFWFKEMIRVSEIPNGWTEKRVTLGKRCPTHTPNMTPIQEQIDTIESFGIPMDKLQELHLSRDEVSKVHNSIVTYRNMVNYLKGIRDRMNYHG